MKTLDQVKPVCSDMTEPKKWTLAAYEGEKNRLVIGENGELIADCFAPCFVDYPMPEDYQANARLIAAAPELLAALKSAELLCTQTRLANSIGNHTKTKQICFLLSQFELMAEELNTAILKAKGEV